MQTEVLDGGCILFRLPSRPKVWRPMTEEERALALGIGHCFGFDGEGLAQSMARKALEPKAKITDKQGQAIRAMAQRFGVTRGPRGQGQARARPVGR
jgi:hypothetical protein